MSTIHPSLNPPFPMPNSSASFFQSISDLALLSYRDGQTLKLGVYLVGGIGAVAAYTAAASLFTFLALHSHRGLRWSVGLGAGACFFLLGIVAVMLPGLGRSSRAGFFLAGLPWWGNLVLWAVITCFPSSLRLPPPSLPRGVGRSFSWMVRRRPTISRAYAWKKTCERE